MTETGKGFYVETQCGQTLEAHEDQHRRNLVCAGFSGGQGSKAGGIGYSEETAPTIKASPSGGNQVPDVVCAAVASTLNTHYGDKMGLENQHVNEGCPLYVVHGAQTPINNTEHANALGTRNNGLENVICQVNKDNEK